MKAAGIVGALRAAPLEREDLPVLRQALRARRLFLMATSMRTT